jgi:outer membrane protein assembly factor BamB
MRGQKMRCPNAICREVFEVRDADAETVTDGQTAEAPAGDEKLDSARKPPGTEKQYVAGAVGEIVPFLSSEAADVPAAPDQSVEAPPPAAKSPSAGDSPPPPEVPSWQKAPPPVRRDVSAAPAVSAPAAKAPPPTPSWQQAPPPVRRSAEPPKAEVPRKSTDTVSRPAIAEKKTEPPQETKPPRPKDTVQAKRRTDTPVDSTAITPRQPKLDAAKEMAADLLPLPPRRTLQPHPAEEPVTEGPTSPARQAESETDYVPATRRTARWLIPLMLLFVAGVGGAAFWYVIGQQKETEDQLVQKAKDAYDDGTYSAATKAYDDVLKNFPDSARTPEYRFWKDFSQARYQVKSPDVEGSAALQHLQAFIAKYKDDPLLKERKPDVWDCYRKLLDDKLLRVAEQPVTEEKLKAIRDAKVSADEVKREAEKYADDLVSAELEKRLANIDAAIIRFERVKEEAAKLAAMKDPSWEDIDAEELRLRQAGLIDDPKIQPLIVRLRSDKLLSGTFKPAGHRPLFVPPPEDSGLPVVPRVDTGGTGTTGNGVVLALARGVLYALAESDGRLLWWTRVGIDTTTLPVRLPAGETNPEVILVLSSDSNTLTARAAQTGAALWRYDLGAPCLGRPVIVGRRAYVATTVKVPQPDGKPREEGRVHEIEIVKGHVLGEYQLGLPLTGSGARQAGTSLLYFPADRGYLYVLDADKQKCVAVLHTGHPSGSLRGEPVLVSDDLPAPAAGTAAGPPRYLVLSQADGLDAMRLRAWRLPLDKVVDAPPLQPEPRIRGWSWFPPHCDGEKIVLATDAGVLGLFGINQYHNTDPPLFPLFSHEVQLQGNSRQPGRAQVVHATESDFWALARGRLQHWRKGLAADGQKVAAVWKDPLELGSPLHDAQVSDGGDTLFVVTQSPVRQACLATAVDAATGEIRWQRQLGLSCQGDPLLHGTRVVALDQSGSLFAFDPERKDALLPVERGDIRGAGSWLLPGEDGFFALSIPAPGKLAVRRFGSKKPGDNQTRLFTLPAVPAGTPALGGDSLVLPLADGLLARLALKTNARDGVDRGLHWRAAHADADALGQVVFLGGDEFLVTDGSRQLYRVRWPPANAKEAWSITAKCELGDRIVAAPLVVSEPAASNSRVLVADSAGNLVLLQLQGKEIKEIRRWPLDGKITSGPFLRGNRVGCVVDRRQLVWIDPAKDQPLWSFIAPGEAIVGQPQQVGELVVVADLGGKFVGLDAQTGKQVGPGYLLKASVAPAATPVSFGPDRLFAPLTDGTVLLLPIKQPEKQ